MGFQASLRLWDSLRISRTAQCESAPLERSVAYAGQASQLGPCLWTAYHRCDVEAVQMKRPDTATPMRVPLVNASLAMHTGSCVSRQDLIEWTSLDARGAAFTLKNVDSVGRARKR
jgi:hypothetical protein